MDRTDIDMLQCFFKIGKEMIAESDMNRSLSIALDNAMEITNAERGMIILYNEESEIVFQALKNLHTDDLKRPEFEICWSIIHEVKCEETVIYHPYGQKLQEHCRTGSLKNYSVICLPLYHKGKIFGIIYLDNQVNPIFFAKETVTFVEKFANFISPVAYRVLERKEFLNRVTAQQTRPGSNYHFNTIIGQHPEIMKILKIVAQVADTEATILIQGESGTGKELVAHALHNHCGRKDKTFVPINCGALTDNLLESELFGHVKGSFTGAIKDKQGWFEQAEGGTIFLDEVSEMTSELQVKLLRVLQTGEFSKVGSTDIRYCNVRIIAATNRDLHKMALEGKFREDLYYRLNVIKIELPPLRSRKSDIPILANHFLALYSEKYRKNNLYLSKDAEACLLSYDYPGNVRELENIMQHAVIMADSNFIEPDHLPIMNHIINHADQAYIRQNEEISTFKVAKQRLIETFEREYIIDCLKATKGNISRAADNAGIHFTSFHTKMVKYGIAPYSYKQ